MAEITEIVEQIDPSVAKTELPMDNWFNLLMAYILFDARYMERVVGLFS
jgi:hypothetical protein